MEGCLAQRGGVVHVGLLRFARNDRGTGVVQCHFLVKSLTTHDKLSNDPQIKNQGDKPKPNLGMSLK